MAKHQPINRNYEAGIWNKEEGPTPEQKKAERDKLMKEFLAKGGKVEKLAPGVAKVYGAWDRHGKAPYSDAELKAKWKKEQENGSENTEDAGWNPRSAE
tara:strand:- start:856 stop:1152 length:297 start_codon:yes stop_codon:yes gene_type:complete